MPSSSIINIIIMYENLEAPPPAKCAQCIKIANIASGAFIASFGFVGIIYMFIQHILSLRFFLLFSPIFMTAFGLALIAIEMRSQYILETFGFLKSLQGRGIFNLYMASQVYYFFSCPNQSSVLAWISAMVLFSLGLVYLGLHHCAGTGYTQSLKEQLS